MATIVTRAGKGSALSHNEVDANFTNLNSDKLEANSNITVADATVTGDLTVQGTTTTLNTATLQVEDKNITLNYSTGDSSGSADGAGITIQDAVSSSTDATILWDATNDTFDFSHAIQVQGLVDIASGEIGLKNSGSVSNIKFYCEVGNAHYTALQSSPHSAYSGNVTLTLPPATDTLVGRATTDTLTNKTLTSPTVNGGTHTSFASTGIDDNASSTAITIDSSERVGVNVTDPDEKLEVGGDVKIGQSGDSGVLHFGNTSDQTKIIGRGSSHSSLPDTLTFSTGNTQRMIVDASGRVGISNASPTADLHIGDGSDGAGVVGLRIDARTQASSTDVRLTGNGVVASNVSVSYVTGSGDHIFRTGTSDADAGLSDSVERMRVASSGLQVSASSGDAITLKDTNLTASSSDIGNVRVAWDDSAGTRVAYVGTVNSNEFWVNNQYANVVLSFAGSRMFETVSGGAKLYGKLNITDSDYDNHLELNRSSEQWRFSPSTDGSLDIRRLTGTGTAYLDVLNLLRVTPTSGSITIGPQNTGFCHFSTDRPKHYFNKPVHMDGGAVDYDTGDHFLLPNANNSESPNTSTARNGGAINYIYSVSSNTTLTRGDFAHHIIQQWSNSVTFTITSSTFLRGDIIEFINVRGAVTITVVGTRIYLPTGSYDTTLTLSQEGKFRLIKYSTNAGYWMLG